MMRKCLIALMVLLSWAACASAVTPGIYTMNLGGALLSYPLTGTGNISPTTDVTGGNTGFSANMSGVCADLTTHIWVTDVTNNILSMFNQTDNGNVAPTRTISGGNTTLSGPTACRFDASGNMWVANQGAKTVLQFTAAQVASGGNLIPTTSFTYASFNSAPAMLAVDSTGNIFVSQFGSLTCSSNDCLTFMFASGSSGSVSPTYTWSFYASLGAVDGIALDGHPYLYFNDLGGAATVAIYHNIHASSSSAPDATIAGGSTHLSSNRGLAVDTNGTVVVANGTPASILVWYPGHVGNVAPDQDIVGASTSLSTPVGIAIVGTFTGTSATPFWPFP